MTEETVFVECGDDRFEIIAKAKKHILEATNIEMSPKEMEVLDNFLFRCWQMGWLKNDYKVLEKENERLKEEIQNMRNSVKEVLLSDDCEVGQILKCVGLSWYEKEYVEGLKRENEMLRKQVNSQVGKYCDESGS